MKTIDFVYGGLILFFIVVAIIAFTAALKNNAHENKDKVDGNVLGRDALPKEEVDFLNGERPFIDGPENYN